MSRSTRALSAAVAVVVLAGCGGQSSTAGQETAAQDASAAETASQEPDTAETADAARVCYDVTDWDQQQEGIPGSLGDAVDCTGQHNLEQVDPVTVTAEGLSNNPNLEASTLSFYECNSSMKRLERPDGQFTRDRDAREVKTVPARVDARGLGTYDCYVGYNPRGDDISQLVGWEGSLIRVPEVPEP